MSDFLKKYTPQNIQQETISGQNRSKLRGPKEAKLAKEKNTITMLFAPIALEPQTTSLQQLFQWIQQDTLGRYFRMSGKIIRTRPIFSYKTTSNDHEKGKTLQREKALNKQKEKRNRYLIQLGFAFDETTQETLFDPMNARKIRNFITSFAQKGWISKEYTINYRSNRTQTNIATDDIIWKKIKDKVYALRYFVDTKNITLTVSTTNPETIFGDVALAVHPEDRRYKKLIKHKVIIPIINKTIPIIGDETVDPNKGNGIIRVTPCHDVQSLEIAKRHGLEFNTFAIDHNGCFTKLAGDFCGKKVGEFFENIIQNLEDIHNMESIQQSEYEVATDKHYGERLQPIICEQRFLHQPENDKHSIDIPGIIESIDIQPQEVKEEIVKNISTIQAARPISKKDPFGINLPLWKNKKDEQFFLGEQTILDLPSKKTKNKKIIPALLLFNLIVDQHLPQYFTIDELIDVIFTSHKGEKTLGELYMDAFTQDIPRGYKQEINEILKLFEYTQKDKGIANLEKLSSQLMTILEKTCIVTNRKNGTYNLDFNAMVKSEEEIIQSDEKIDSNLATSLLLLEIGGFFSNKESEKTMMFVEEKDINNAVKTVLLGASLTKKNTIETIYSYPETGPLSEGSLHEIIEKRGSDTLRLYSCISGWETSKTQITEMENYFGFINKTRNACRYIFTAHIETQKKKKQEEKKDLDEMNIYLEKKITKSDPMEYRMIYRIKELYEELADHKKKNTMNAYGKKVLDCVKKDFCDKYLEIIKIRQNDLTGQTAIFCVGMLLKLLSPFMPFTTERLWEIFNFKGILINQKLDTFFEKGSKNYKTQLFMDIIDKFGILRDKIQQPKHQKVEICFSASLDFLQYIKENEEIILKLTNAEKIEYIDKEQDLQKYETDSIINVTIGMRGLNRPIKQESGYPVELILQQKKDELQKLRNITAKLTANKAGKRAIDAKKEEMSQLKSEIEKLEYELSKIRMEK